jgi:hypothetical protein
MKYEYESRMMFTDMRKRDNQKYNLGKTSLNL